MNTPLHPQYVTDESGKRVSVMLPIEEYRALIDHLEALEDLHDAREAIEHVKRGEEKTIPWETIKAEHGL